MNRIIIGFLLILGICNLAVAYMSDEEFNKEFEYCKEGNTTSCQYLIDNANLRTLEQCTKANGCPANEIGIIYFNAGDIDTAIEFYKKAISFGDERALGNLGVLYYKQKDYINAKKYFELACKSKNNSIKAERCFALGIIYENGSGVRQDFKKAIEYYKKSCEAGDSKGCNNLGALYYKGQGVRQNQSTAKEYFGKACDLGEQTGCDNYKELNERGIK